MTSDADTLKLKGKCVMTEFERAECVYHSRYVDEVVVRCPWVITQEFIDQYQIDYVVHGEDAAYDDSGEDAYKFIKSINKFKTIKRTEGVSTSDLIMRLLKNYPTYIERCINRGSSYTDMNIPENVWVSIGRCMC